MVFDKFTDYKLWIFIAMMALLVFGAAAGGYYYFAANQPITTSISPDSSLQPNLLYQVVEEVDRELLLVEGVIVDVTLEQTENLAFPDQHFVTLRSQSLPHATFKISLGPPQRPLRVYYPGRETLPEAVVGETIEVNQLAEQLVVGNQIGVELSFPLIQPEIKSAFMDELNRFSQDVANNSDPATFDVHYFRTHRVNIYE
jgi:hypothetical protein